MNKYLVEIADEIYKCSQDESLEGAKRFRFLWEGLGKIGEKYGFEEHMKPIHSYVYPTGEKLSEILVKLIRSGVYSKAWGRGEKQEPTELVRELDWGKRIKCKLSK